MRLVVDASVAVRWFLPESHSELAAELLTGRHQLSAPDFLLIEVASVFWKRARRGETTSADGDTALRHLTAGVIEVVPSPVLLPLARRIADRLGHPVYDTLYLAAALTLDATVVTADRRFWTVAGGSEHERRMMWIEGVPRSS